MSEVSQHPWVVAGAKDSTSRQHVGLYAERTATPAAGTGLSEEECDARALAEMVEVGFQRDTVISALSAGKRNAISAT